MPDFERMPLTVETLRVLLSEAAERDGLDCKQTCDLADRGATVEIAKDIGAMQIDGGWIIVGADENGAHAGRLDQRAAGLFDPATLTAKTAKYLSAGFVLDSSPIEIDGKWFALVRVSPHPDVIAPFAADGAYARGARPNVAFRAGDVFARHGTRSERWNVEDVRRCRQIIAARERDAARADFSRELAEVAQSVARTDGLARAAIGTLTWTSDVDAVVEAALEQVRTGDDVPLRLLMPSFPRLVADPVSDPLDVETGMDAAASVAGGLLFVGRHEEAMRTFDALKRAFDATFTPNGSDRTDLPVDALDARLGIITRAWAIGALAVRVSDWAAVRGIAGHRPPIPDVDYWSNWLFHGVVWAARGNRLQDPQDVRGKSPLMIAAGHVARLPWLRQDVLPATEHIITSLCQFDLLADVVAFDEAIDNPDPFLGHFGRWYAVRSDPAARLLIDDAAARRAILPGAGDFDLAEALRAVSHGAEHTFGSGRSAYEDPGILAFLNSHPAPSR